MTPPDQQPLTTKFWEGRIFASLLPHHPYCQCTPLFYFYFYFFLVFTNFTKEILPHSLIEFSLYKKEKKNVFSPVPYIIRKNSKNESDTCVMFIFMYSLPCYLLVMSYLIVCAMSDKISKVFFDDSEWCLIITIRVIIIIIRMVNCILLSAYGFHHASVPFY